MPSPQPLCSSPVPSGTSITTFDRVVLDGRELFVCADHASRVFSWDPLTDAWRQHELDNPFGEHAKEYLGADLEAFGAVVVDGRIIVGGGGQHQSFAQWDLESGAVRVHANEWDPGPDSVIGSDIDGTTVFVVGDYCGRVALWDAAEIVEYSEDYDETGEYDNPEPFLLEDGNQDGTLAVLPGSLDDKPIVVAHTYDGGVRVWKVNDVEVTAEFPMVPSRGKGLAWATMATRPSVVMPAGRNSLLLGDPETGQWTASIGDVEAETDVNPYVQCVDTAVADGVPIAVTGAADGTVRVWNLADLTAASGPFRAHEGEVFAVRVCELDGRQVAVTAGRDGRMRVWNLTTS